MSSTAIKVENLGKSYQIGELDSFYDMRDAISDTLKMPFRIFSKNGKKRIKEEKNNTIWALKDINFEVKHGEIIGVIGKNGAGKSTLLKILSRITSPTEGLITLNGRVGSLLEVGTGFHPELTGRENIFLNGSILGMSKKEIERKFDEIVDFSEIEKFIDTPVKRYSSGMYVRLAFAVAAHLEPEILLIDEVLAVGDIAFQKKCLGKMDDVSKEGRTILFVSHNMGSISRLCPKSILLSKGKNVRFGMTEDVMSNYVNLVIKKNHANNDYKGLIFEDENILVNNFYPSNANKELKTEFNTTEKIGFILNYKLKKKLKGLRIGLEIANSNDETIFRSFDDDMFAIDRSTELKESYCFIPPNFLKKGEYFIYLIIGIPKVKWFTFRDISQHIYVENVNGVDSNYHENRPGYVMPDLSWQIENLN